jgi:hypothetical protein
MKKFSFVLSVLMLSGLLFTSCEKERELNPLPSAGNTIQYDTTKDGDIIVGSDSDSDGDYIPDITDGGRDEDYDKSGRKRRH